LVSLFLLFSLPPRLPACPNYSTYDTGATYLRNNLPLTPLLLPYSMESASFDGIPEEWPTKRDNEANNDWWSRYKYKKRVTILPPAVWIVTIFIISFFRCRKKAHPYTKMEDVSGFYGPGAYWAWILTIFSAAISTIWRDEEDYSISIDFVAACLYTLASMGDVQLRFCSQADIKGDFQAQAALDITYVAFFLTSWIVLFHIWRLGRRESRFHPPTPSRAQRYKHRVWTAFFFVIGVHIMSLGHHLFDILDLAQMEPLMILCLGAFAFAFYLPMSLVMRVTLWIYLEVIIGFRIRTELFSSPISAPRTGAKFTDMDQMISFLTTVVILLVQWRIPQHTLDLFMWFRRSFKRPVASNPFTSSY
jgi:hypothetical protein